MGHFLYQHKKNNKMTRKITIKVTKCFITFNKICPNIYIWVWRYKQVLWIISKVTKWCYESANRILCWNLLINSVKDGNIWGISFPNKYNSSLLDEWTIDFEYHLTFPTKIMLTALHLDLMVWSVHSKEVT